MADIFTGEKRSEIMSKERSSGNKTTEIRLIHLFRESGVTGWRRRAALPGSPDFCFLREKLCLFADGCFWHGCPKCYRAPKSNRKFWRKKIAGNMRRDNKIRRQLRRRGYSVLVARECANANRPQIVSEKDSPNAGEQTQNPSQPPYSLILLFPIIYIMSN